MVDLQLKKANLDQKAKANSEETVDGTGVVLDRKRTFRSIIKRQQRTKEFQLS